MRLLLLEKKNCTSTKIKKKPTKMQNCVFNNLTFDIYSFFFIQLLYIQFILNIGKCFTSCFGNIVNNKDNSNKTGNGEPCK